MNVLGNQNRSCAIVFPSPASVVSCLHTPSLLADILLGGCNAKSVWKAHKKVCFCVVVELVFHIHNPYDWVLCIDSLWVRGWQHPGPPARPPRYWEESAAQLCSEPPHSSSHPERTDRETFNISFIKEAKATWHKIEFKRLKNTVYISGKIVDVCRTNWIVDWGAVFDGERLIYDGAWGSHLWPHWPVHRVINRKPFAYLHVKLLRDWGQLSALLSPHCPLWRSSVPQIPAPWWESS